MDLCVEVESLCGERFGSCFSDCGVSCFGWLFMFVYSEIDDILCVKMVFLI